MAATDLATALVGLITGFLVVVGVLLGDVWARSRALRSDMLRLERNAQMGSDHDQDVPPGVGTGRVVKDSSLKRVRRSLPRMLGGQKQLSSTHLPSVCVEVAARLQAGAATSEAWAVTWERATNVPAGEVDSSGVPASLAEMPGTAAKMVVTATRFSTLTGAPLKDVLLRIADSLNEMEESLSAQSIAFTGPRLSARVLTALPLLGLVGGELLGISPITWFMSGTFPLLIGSLGVGLTLAGHVLSQRMINNAAKVGADKTQAPVLCDLAVSGLSGGSAVPTVLEAIGTAHENLDYERVAAELMLGATWDEAWEPMPSAGSLLERGLQPAWEDGIAATSLLLQLATEARSRSVREAKEAAERLAVKLTLPLGTLLLPAFVILGILPVFFSLVGSEVLPTFFGP